MNPGQVMQSREIDGEMYVRIADVQESLSKADTWHAAFLEVTKAHAIDANKVTLLSSVLGMVLIDLPEGVSRDLAVQALAFLEHYQGTNQVHGTKEA